MDTAPDAPLSKTSRKQLKPRPLSIGLPLSCGRIVGDPALTGAASRAPTRRMRRRIVSDRRGLEEEISDLKFEIANVKKRRGGNTLSARGRIV